jgi:hypothetical protein
MAAKSTDRQYSRYTIGGSVEQNGNLLGFWKRKDYQYDETDELFTITEQYNKRPWLLSHAKYGTVELMWFILDYNNIINPDEEFVTGKVIRLPKPNRLFVDLLR